MMRSVKSATAMKQVVRRQMTPEQQARQLELQAELLRDIPKEHFLTPAHRQWLRDREAWLLERARAIRQTETRAASRGSESAVAPPAGRSHSSRADRSPNSSEAHMTSWTPATWADGPRPRPFVPALERDRDARTVEIYIKLGPLIYDWLEVPAAQARSAAMRLAFARLHRADRMDAIRELRDPARFSGRRRYVYRAANGHELIIDPTDRRDGCRARR
jgi:hypothetical protein